MAKPPVAGECDARLSPPLHPAQAATPAEAHAPRTRLGAMLELLGVTG